jgi:glycosyltransferase involved in cell wall biosynthesis
MAIRPTFSIVTPSFNQPDLLAGCVFSVAAQVGEGCTVNHIVQDAGTSGIEDLAVALGAEYFHDGKLIHPADPARISSGYSLQIHRESDHGMYDAINRGLIKSHGQFCAWLNCDERYAEGSLREIAHHFETNPVADAVFGDMVVVDSRNSPLCYRRGVVQNARLLAFSALNISSCTLFFRRHLVEQGLLLDPAWRVIGDKEWIARLIRAGIQFHPIHKPIACFRLLPDSLTASPQAAVEEARFARLQSIPSFTARWTLKLNQAVRKFLAGSYWPRYVDLHIPESSGQLTRIGPAWVGFRWPKSI